MTHSNITHSYTTWLIPMWHDSFIRDIAPRDEILETSLKQYVPSKNHRLNWLLRKSACLERGVSCHVIKFPQRSWNSIFPTEHPWLNWLLRTSTFPERGFACHVIKFPKRSWNSIFPYRTSLIKLTFEKIRLLGTWCFLPRHQVPKTPLEQYLSYRTSLIKLTFENI